MYQHQQESGETLSYCSVAVLHGALFGEEQFSRNTDSIGIGAYPGVRVAGSVEAALDAADACNAKG